jgi:hypothetical protein
MFKGLEYTAPAQPLDGRMAISAPLRSARVSEQWLPNFRLSKSVGDPTGEIVDVLVWRR